MSTGRPPTTETTTTTPRFRLRWGDVYPDFAPSWPGEPPGELLGTCSAGVTVERFDPEEGEEGDWVDLIPFVCAVATFHDEDEVEGFEVWEVAEDEALAEAGLTRDQIEEVYMPW